VSPVDFPTCRIIGCLVTINLSHASKHISRKNIVLGVSLPHSATFHWPLKKSSTFLFSDSQILFTRFCKTNLIFNGHLDQLVG